MNIIMIMFPISLHTTARSKEQPYLCHKVLHKYSISLVSYFLPTLRVKVKRASYLIFGRTKIRLASVSPCSLHDSFPDTFHNFYHLSRYIWKQMNIEYGFQIKLGTGTRKYRWNGPFLSEEKVTSQSHSVQSFVPWSLLTQCFEILINKPIINMLHKNFISVSDLVISLKSIWLLKQFK